MRGPQGRQYREAISRRTLRAPRPLAAANVILAIVALVCVISMITPLTTPLMPVTATARHAVPRTVARESAQSDYLPRDLQAASSRIIVVRDLFSPTRTEPSAEIPTPSSTPMLQPPLLHGVVINGPNAVAYLEDIATKSTAGYRIGDKIGGGTVETISHNDVTVKSSHGPIRIGLRDPSRRRSETIISIGDRVLPSEPPAFRGVLPPDVEIAKPLRPPH